MKMINKINIEKLIKMIHPEQYMKPLLRMRKVGSNMNYSSLIDECKNSLKNSKNISSKIKICDLESQDRNSPTSHIYAFENFNTNNLALDCSDSQSVEKLRENMSKSFYDDLSYVQSKEKFKIELNVLHTGKKRNFIISESQTSFTKN